MSNRRAIVLRRERGVAGRRYVRTPRCRKGRVAIWGEQGAEHARVAHVGGEDVAARGLALGSSVRGKTSRSGLAGGRMIADASLADVSLSVITSGPGEQSPESGAAARKKRLRARADKTASLADRQSLRDGAAGLAALHRSSAGCKSEIESKLLPRRRLVYTLLANIGRHLRKEEWLGWANRHFLNFERAPVFCGKRDHDELVPGGGGKGQNGDMDTFPAAPQGFIGCGEPEPGAQVCPVPSTHILPRAVDLRSSDIRKLYFLRSSGMLGSSSPQRSIRFPRSRQRPNESPAMRKVGLKRRTTVPGGSVVRRERTRPWW